MLRKRLIPILTIINYGLYKTTKFKNPSYIGDPINAIKIFNEKEVDELLVVDMGIAKRKSKNINYSYLESFANECRMPLSYGGSVMSTQEAEKIFSLGYEKISINSANFESRNLLYELAKQFGSQSIVCSVDIKKSFFGEYKIYDSYNYKSVNCPVNNYLKSLEDSGAGEIIVTDIDREGTLKGPSTNFLNSVCADEINIPLVYNGGVSSLEEFEIVLESGYDACCAGAWFVYSGPHKAVIISYPYYDEIKNLD